MTTAEALEDITDSGDFEVLATRVLRIEDEDCRVIEHMGVNAVGKTIPNPIDGFCLVPNSDPPRFVMTAYTTEKLESLERKWLFDHSIAPRAKKSTSADDGDLIKAARRAESLRQDHPKAKFIIHLCTNRQPDDAVMAKVYHQARKLGLEARLLARSRLRDCLDTKPEGQWLRKEHLGIQAELLSLPLLLDLSKKSLQEYGKEFLFTPPDAFVSTASQTTLQHSVSWPRTTSVVTGMSGTGKSVACYQVLHNHISEGYCGLWIPGELAAKSATLAEAVELTLRSLYPTIITGAGAFALKLLTPPSQLLLVVDDINRGGTPSETLHKVIVWGQPSHSNGNKTASPSHHQVVPAWDLFWSPLKSQLTKAEWLAEIPITPMMEEEAQICLEASLGSQIKTFDTASCRQILETLNRDPILITMFAELAKANSASNQLELAHQVMEHFSRSAEADAAIRGKHLQGEYRTALIHLATKMLTERKLYPSWDNIQQWLSSQDVGAIRELTTLKKLCCITERNGASHFEFRHDRILEHYLVHALMPMLINPGEHQDILSDPYYASFIGKALTVSTQPTISIPWICIHAPLALVAAIRFCSSENKDAGIIVKTAKDWLVSASSDRPTQPTALYAAYRLLEGTDSEFVLEVTESLSHNRLLARARLANGDALAGAIEFSDKHWFPPSVTDHALDAILSRGYARHKQTLCDGCKQMFNKPDLTDDDRHGILILAGFMADPVFAQPIRACWDSASNRQSILSPSLWAAFRCGSEEPAALLDPMMGEWASLSDESHGSISDRDSVADELRFAMRRDIPDTILQYLIEVAKSNDPLRWPITHLLEYVDHPVVVRFMVEEAANLERRIKESNGFSPWLMNLRNQWDPTNQTQGRRLRPESVAIIRSCWESAEYRDSLRETAFELWVHALDDIPTLQTIKPNHPGYKHVLRRRAKLADMTTVPLIRPLITSDKHWFHLIHHIWTVDFLDATDQAFLKLHQDTPTDYSGGWTNDHYMLAHLLRDIPVSDAEVLLTKHWSHVQYSPLFIQVALYLGTPKLQTLARQAVQSYPANVYVLKHIGMFFGFFTHGLSARLSAQHLDVLIPYLTRLDDSTLSSMAEFCDRHGYRDWGKLHLQPEFERRRANLPKSTRDKQEYVERLGRCHFPSDIDLLEDLDWIEQQGRHYPGHLWHWCEEFERRQDDRIRWRRLLEQWLNQSPTTERFRLFSEAILEHGTREDLLLLIKYTITGDQNEIARIIANTRFGIMCRSLQ